MCKDWIWRNKCTKSLEYKYLTQKMSFYQHNYRLICHFMMLLPMSFINEKVLQHPCIILIQIFLCRLLAVRPWDRVNCVEIFMRSRSHVCQDSKLCSAHIRTPWKCRASPELWSFGSLPLNRPTATALWLPRGRRYGRATNRPTGRRMQKASHFSSAFWH